MTEQEIVKKNLVEIFNKNGYADLNDLTQRDFDNISHAIEEKTGTLISGSTIKRLLHGRFSRLPQIATLDAISNYLGCKSWQEYKSAIQVEEFLPGEKKRDLPGIKTRNVASPKSKAFKLIVMACLAIGIIVIVGFIQFSKSKQVSNFDKASFSARKNTSHEIPNTVVFEYNIDEVIADSFFIQQSWDKNRRVRIFKKTHTLTDIYYEPGYHIAKLIANDSVIKAVEISIPTDQWFFFAKDNPSSNPEYINADNSLTDGVFRITEKDLLKNKIDIGKEKEYVYSFFPSKLNVNSDNFILKTKVRMTEVKNNFCPYITLEVFSQRYTMFFKSTPKGCSSESMLQFGERFISGKDKDLASLGFDVKDWTEVELYVKDRQGTILLNNKEVFTMSYQTSSKLITGLGFTSNGLCEIDFIELKGLDGTVFYESKFDVKNQ